MIRKVQENAVQNLTPGIRSSFPIMHQALCALITGTAVAAYSLD